MGHLPPPGKERAPTRQSQAEVDEVTPGRVIYCRAPGDEETKALVALFNKTPNAALVYPGFTVGEGWPQDADIWTSDGIKGLDFPMVGVLDIGKQLAKIEELGRGVKDGEPFKALWGRTRADQIRVALSRATDTLVLIDRATEPKYASQIESLCSKTDDEMLDGYFEQMDVEELTALLTVDHKEAGAQVAGYIENIQKIIHEQPERALKLARLAHGTLGSENSPGAVSDVSVRHDVWRLRGVAALLLALTDAKNKELSREANTYLRKAGSEEAAQAALQLRNIAGQKASSAEDVVIVLGGIDTLNQFLPEAEIAIRQTLVAWAKQQAKADVPATPSSRQKLLKAFAQLESVLGERHPELMEERQTALAKVGQSLVSEKRYTEALEFLQQLTHRNFAEEAICYEATGDFTRATDSWELAGDNSAALRTVRRIPDFERALRLAKPAEPDAAARLQWAQELRGLLQRAKEVSAVLLTSEERAALSNEFEAYSKDIAEIPAETTRAKKK